MTTPAFPDNTASRLAEKHFGSLSPDVAFALDAEYQKALRRGRLRLLNPLGPVRPDEPNVFYYWQFTHHDPLAPAKDGNRNLRENTRIRIYFIAEDQEPYYIEVKLANYVNFPHDLDQLSEKSDFGATLDSWVKDKIILPNLDARSRRLLVKARKKTLSENARKRKPIKSTLYYGFPIEHDGRQMNHDGQFSSHYAFHQDQSFLSAAFRRLLRLPAFAASSAQVQEAFQDECAKALRQQLATEEAVRLAVYVAHLDPKAVKSLQENDTFSDKAYHWLRYGAQSPKVKERILNERDYRYRRQFLAAAPFFAHLALRRSLRRDSYMYREELSQLGSFIQSGQELFAINTDDEGRACAGRGLQIFAAYLRQYYEQIREDRRFGLAGGPELEIRLRLWPKGLRQLAKMKASDIGDLHTFLLVLPKLIGCDPTQLPRTPAEWKIAKSLLLDCENLPQELIWRDAGRNWENVLCGLKARLESARRAGGIHAAETLEGALSHCHDYLNQIFDAVILPAAVAVSGRPADSRPGEPYPAWLRDKAQRDELKKRFVSLFTLNTVLENSLQYHREHVLQAFGAALFKAASANEKEGHEWLAPTVDFTIPPGTRHGGVDIGGTKIIWLTNPHALRVEGGANKNCVGSYTNDCINHGYHVLRLLAPGTDKSDKTLIHTTASIKEETNAQKLRQVVHKENKRVSNQWVLRGSPSDAALDWLVEQINKGQERRAQNRPAHSATPAPLDLRTGLPDFTQIDFTAIDAVRTQHKSFSHGGLSYDPFVPGAFAEVLANAKQQKILPNGLRHLETPEEILAALGVRAEKGQLLFEETPRRPGTKPVRPNDHPPQP